MSELPYYELTQLITHGGTDSVRIIGILGKVREIFQLLLTRYLIKGDEAYVITSIARGYRTLCQNLIQRMPMISYLRQENGPNQSGLWKELTLMVNDSIIEWTTIENYLDEHLVEIDDIIKYGAYFIEHINNSSAQEYLTERFNQIPSGNSSTWERAFTHLSTCWAEYSPIYFDKLAQELDLSEQLTSDLIARWNQDFHSERENISRIEHRTNYMSIHFSDNLAYLQELSKLSLVNELGTTENYANFLNRVFGLTDFARYPLDHLKLQAETAFNRDRKYRPVFYPEACFNGAFYADKHHFNKLNETTTNNDPLSVFRYFEVGEHFSLIEALQFCNCHYNTENAQLLIIGGHGNTGVIYLGLNSSERIDFSDHNQRIAIMNELSLLIPASAPIIILSCTGYTEDPLSAVKFISTQLPHNSVAGSHSQSYLKTLSGEYDTSTEELKLTVVFADADNKQDTTVILINGEIIN
jgi:hypothetical protein